MSDLLKDLREITSQLCNEDSVCAICYSWRKRYDDLSGEPPRQISDQPYLFDKDYHHPICHMLRKIVKTYGDRIDVLEKELERVRETLREERLVASYKSGMTEMGR